MMRGIISFGLITLTTAAAAADLPTRAPLYKAPPPAYINWTGCYIGGNIGWAETRHDYTGVVGGAAGLSESGHRASGFAGGGQIGCDYQFASSWVIGIRGLADWANFRGSNFSPVFPDHHVFSTNHWFGTVTGRLGFLVTPSFLIYGEAGWGWVNERNGWAIGTVGTVVGDHPTFDNVDVGAGFEWMFAPNWSLWAEWDHIFRRNQTLLFTGTFTFPEIVRRDFDKVLVGLNWRFGSPLIARY
jgi:outer membrane immunogenic protein